METLNLTKEILELWVKTIYKPLIDEGWEIFKIYNADHIYAVKIRIKYREDEIKFNEDGYKYKQLFVNINNTREYLFFLKNGYAVDKLF